jgi:KUP system potassium uptake protein
VANAVKFVQGGWLPIALGLAFFACFTTWKRGRAELAERFARGALDIDNFLAELARNPVHRVRGTAVFLSSSTTLVSPVLLHHLKHNQVLHEQVLLLSVLPLNVPEVPLGQRVRVESLGQGFHRVVAQYGYRQSPRVPEILRRARVFGLSTKPETTSFYVGRETVLPRGRSQMARWRKILFRVISRNARASTDFFSIPPGGWWSWGCRSTCEDLAFACRTVAFCVGDPVGARVAVLARSRGSDGSGGSSSPLGG